MFIYDLPYDIRCKLVSSLNAGDAWRDLAGRQLEYDYLDLQRISEARFKPGDSPADALLTHWGQRNGTVEELFRHLHALGMYQCMHVIKGLVPQALVNRYLLQSPAAATFGQNGESDACGGARKKVPSPPLPPPLPAQRTDTWIKNNLNLKGAEKKIINKELNLPNVYEETRDENAVSKAAAAPAPAPATSITATNNSTRQQQLYSDTTSRLKTRMPSGVPLPGDDVFLQNIPFEVLKEACSGFDRDAPGILLGHGGFGEVFRGKWNGQDVAVKRILEEKRFQLGSDAYQRCINQAITELHALHSYPAENVLPLLAYSYDKDFRTDPCLVYQFMSQGSVGDRLKRKSGTPPLTWLQRATIALGTARGLVHLHGNNIIHGDIKSANILLDRHFEPKIGDFGLARGGPENTDASFKMVSCVKGTQAYLPDDYMRSHELTPAVDTFCFGIFMFELVSARSPSYAIPDCPDGLRVRDVMLESPSPEPWVDSSVPASSWSQLLFYAGKDCAKRTRKSRPPMKAVMEALDKLLQQPTQAMALQSYYDEKMVRRNVPCSTCDSRTNAAQSDQLIPAILQGYDGPATADTGASALEAANLTSSSTSASFSVVVDDPSLPNLSLFLSSRRANDTLEQSHESNNSKNALPSDLSMPDLSMLRVAGGVEDDDDDRRLAEIEQSASRAASYSIL